MIEGVVYTALEAVIAIPVSGPAGQTQEVEAVIDTGYNGTLTVPPVLVRDLGLPFVTSGRATLANGIEDVFDVYDVTLFWEGQPMSVLVDAADTTPLVGMALLESHSLYVEVRSGGRVIIGADEHIQASTTCPAADTKSRLRAGRPYNATLSSKVALSTAKLGPPDEIRTLRSYLEGHW